MKCITSVATYSIALIIFSAFSVREAAAVQITLNLVQADSYMTLDGFFGGQPFKPQDAIASPATAAVPGTTDFNLAFPSNKTSYQGTLTIDVDNPLLPTSIKLVSSAANADLSGKWLPENYAFLPNDVDGDLNTHEFPDDASSSVGTTPGVAADADHSFRIRPTGAPDVAYGAYRDVEFNIRTLDNANAPTFVPVNGLGEFSSTSENFEFATGWFDYWLHPTFTAEKLRQRLELAGGDEDNLLAGVSKYEFLPLGGGLSLMKVTIPINYDIPDTTAPTHHSGQFVATLIVDSNIPEPTSFVLLSLGGIACAGVRRRK